MKKLLITATLCLMPTLGFAADMQVKAKPRILLTYLGSGMYYGAHTFAQSNRIDASSPAGSTLGGTFAVGAALGGTFGYMWGDGTTWKAVEAMASYKNISAANLTTNGAMATIDSKISFTQRAKFGGDPIMAIFNMLPNLSTQFPVLPSLPVGAIGTSHPYLFGALHEDDVSGSIGANTGKAWQVKGGFGIGLMSQMGATASNPNGIPITADVWAEFIPTGASINVGIPSAKVSTGREARVGLGFYW